jgi:hypothetical protein
MLRLQYRPGHRLHVGSNDIGLMSEFIERQIVTAFTSGLYYEHHSSQGRSEMLPARTHRDTFRTWRDKLSKASIPTTA